MNEPRALPLGRAEFDVWSDRIIAGAMISASREDQKFALADMIMHLGPAEDHKPDAHFIHYLRKVAVNQVAHAIRMEIKDAKDQNLAELLEEKKREIDEEIAREGATAQ